MTALNSESPDDEALCKDSFLYPRSLMRASRPHEVHFLDKHVQYLNDNEKKLFHEKSENHLIEICEINTEKQNLVWKSNIFKTSDSQVRYLQKTAKQRGIRHVRFLKASDSRSPLKCSLQMLKSCFTYHQVDPSFLESVYTFGDQEKPKDLCLAHFKGSHTIGIDENDLVSFPTLHRSGHELRMSYLLRSMESDAETSKPWKWKLRQTAVYHSFDAKTGQSFWCNIKANDEFRNRIKNSASSLNLGKPETEQEHRVHRLFTAALSTHLIYLYWCDENWRWCINDMEVAINKILEKARMAPIDDGKSAVPEHIIRRATTFNTTTTKETRKNADQSSWTLIFQSVRAPALSLPKSLKEWHELLFQPRKSTPDVEMGLLNAAPNQRPPPVHPLITLDQFRFSELQALQLCGERIEQSVLAIQLNIAVLSEISAYYSALTDPLVLLHSDMKHQYEVEIRYFTGEIANIVRGLETRKTQLHSLAAQLSEGQKLYDGLLQYRNIQIGQTFAESAEISAKKMESIAYKTAQETASMHIITIVTLIFLPGTFVATFFQSGVFWWKDAPDDMEGAWSYRGDAFAFFACLCFPLMAATLGIWLCVWYKMRRDRHREEQKNLAIG